MSRSIRLSPYVLPAALAAIAASFNPSMAQPRSWQIESVESPRTFSWMTDRSLCLDAQGNPHLAFGQDHLYHGWLDGTEWVVETVDQTPGVGEHASIASGADGSLHIAYFDDLNRDLKYARRDDDGWHIETVGSGGKFTSVALDAEGRPHITYQDEDLNYAWKADDGWRIEVIDVPYAPGGFSSLALAQDGMPHISHYEMILDNLLYSFKDGEGWHTETIAEQGDAGMHSSIAIDDTGRPHISYNDRWQYSIAYARKDPAGWQIEALGQGGSWTSLALDAQGAPHIGFCTTSGPVHAHHDGSAWIMETLTGPADYASLAVDDAGGVHFSYHVWDSFAGTRGLRFSRKTQGVWETDTVSQAADVGTYTALALDFSGFVHACYVNSVDEGLRYAVQTEDGWEVQAVGQAGIDLSLALDQQGYPHIAFHDDDGDAIRHLCMDGAGWHVETVQGDVRIGGGYTSVAIGPDGAPRMVYRVNRELIYAVKADSGWMVETVTPDQGFYTSLKLDPAGYPHIAHHSWADRMCYTYRDVSGWHTEVADNYGEGGMYCSLALDEAGFPHMTYFDNFPDDIRYAYKDAQGWHVETVDSQSDVGKFTSLAIDPEGRPCVSYLYGQAVDLRFAYRDDGTWHSSTVASEGRVGEWSRLVVDTVGHPHVIYYDETRGDLMYARADAVGAGLWEGRAVGPGALTLLSVGPNPASTRVSVCFSIRAKSHSLEQPISLRLFDLSGRAVRTHVYRLPGGVHRVPLELTGPGMAPPPAGAYYLQVNAGDLSVQDGAFLIIVP